MSVDIDTGTTAKAQWLVDPITKVPFSASNGFPVALPSQAAAPWVTGATAQDARGFSDVEIQVAGLIAPDTIAVTRSIDGVNYAPVAWLDGVNGTGVTISADQIYGFPGGGYLKWVKTGGAGTPTLTIRAAS